MPVIHQRRFLGIAPKISSHLLGENQAQIASDVNLWSQGLRPMSGHLVGEALDKTGAILTIYRYDDNTEWLAWTQDVNVVPGPINGDGLERIYFTGTDVPRVTTNDVFEDVSPGTSLPPASYILGIPAPVGPPVATDDGAGNITATASWRYTFARVYSDGTSEEGPPSPVSNILTLITRDVSVTMPSGAITHADYGITHKRLYRDEGDGYLFVAQSTLATAAYVDNIATASLGDAIETTAYLGPPDGLIGLIALPNGVLAGFKGKTVYLSEPYRPHAYPTLNQYTVSYKIVGLGAVGTSIVVITEGKPEIGRGVDPAAYSFKIQPGIFPCLSKRSIASSDLGVFWCVPSGMAACDGVSVILATKEFLTKREWAHDFAPATIHGVVHEQRYYGWFTNDTDDEGTLIGGGFILDRSEAAYLVTHKSYAYAAHVIPSEDTLWVVRKNPNAANANYTYQWDAVPADPFAYTWKSRLNIAQGADNFAFVQIKARYGDGLSPGEQVDIAAQIAAVEAYNDAVTETDGEINGHEINGATINGDNMLLDAPSLDYVQGTVIFKYWADGVLKMERTISSDAPVPMPSGFLAEKHEFQLSGAVQVDEVSIATSAEELA